MGEQLHIHEFKTRYRLSSQTRDSRARLDRILQAVMDEALDNALSELGIAANEELCIRELNSRVHLRLQDSDQTLVEQWSEALVGAIQQVIAQEGSQRVVRYRSRMHGLVDFASGVAYARLQRAWAWRQLGFIETDVGLSLSDAADQLVNTATADAHLIVPLFTELAGEGRLMALVQRLRPVHWQQLSQSVAAISSITQQSSSISDARVETLTAAWRDVAERSLSHSLIAQAMVKHPQVFIERQVPLASLIVLITAEREPSLFLRPLAWLTQWLTLLGQQLVQQCPSLMSVAGDWLSEVPTTNEAIAEEHEAVTQMDSLATEFGNREGNALSKNATDISQTRNSNLDQVPVDETDTAAQIHATDPELNEVQALSAPELFTTEWGGIFFLYTLMDELSLPKQMMNDSTLMQRPMGWLLQRLIEGLCPALEGEAVVVVFAGADADAPAPWVEEAPINQAEQAVLNGYVLEISHTLQQRLQWPGETVAMLAWICQRPAQLRLEPAWLTVLLPVTEIDTEIRRAALDLNPGYLAWLGRVVEFIYE